MDDASTSSSFFCEGGCTCRQLRYGLTSKPLFVNCCHCRWCQRETGSAFAVNAMIEADRVELLPPDIHIFTTSKQPWVLLPPGTPAVAEYYKASTLWPKESLERRVALMAKAQQQQ